MYGIHTPSFFKGIQIFASAALGSELFKLDGSCNECDEDTTSKNFTFSYLTVFFSFIFFTDLPFVRK
jgi:hypothetical protein